MALFGNSSKVPGGETAYLQKCQPTDQALQILEE